MKLLIRVGMIAMLSLGSVWAQTPTPFAKPTPPPPPYLKAAPKMSAWTVQFGEAQAASQQKSATGSRIRQINVVRTKALRLVVFTCGDGRREELWSNGTCFVANSAGSATLTGFFMAPESLEEQYQVSDFPEFRWVSKHNYVGTVELEQRPCLVFQGVDFSKKLADWRVDQPGGEKPVSKPVAEKMMTAWIDAETRLPVQWALGNEVRKVIFTPPPSGMLTVPEKIAEIFGQMNRIQDIASGRASRRR